MDPGSCAPGLIASFSNYIAALEMVTLFLKTYSNPKGQNAFMLLTNAESDSVNAACAMFTIGVWCAMGSIGSPIIISWQNSKYLPATGVAVLDQGTSEVFAIHNQNAN